MTNKYKKKMSNSPVYKEMDMKIIKYNFISIRKAKKKKSLSHIGTDVPTCLLQVRMQYPKAIQVSWHLSNEGTIPDERHIPPAET